MLAAARRFALKALNVKEKKADAPLVPEATAAARSSALIQPRFYRLTVMLAETERVAALLDAQRKAAAFFSRIEQSLIRPGLTESQLTRDIAELGRREFGIEQNWHKRIVRAGPNTLAPYDENPPDLVIGEDD